VSKRKHCKHIATSHWLTCEEKKGLNGSDVCREMLPFPHQCPHYRDPRHGTKRRTT